MIAVTDADPAAVAPAADPAAVDRAGDPAHPPADLGLLTGLAAAAVAAPGLAFAARSGAVALLVGVAVVQAVFALAWVFGAEVPGRRGAVLIAAAAAAGADVVVSVWPHGRLGALVAVLGLALPVLFVHQLARGAARVRIVASLAAIAALVVVEVALPALVQMRHEFVDADQGGRVVAAAVGAIGAALVVGYLVDLVVPAPRFDPEVPRGLLGVLAAVGVGAAVGYLLLRDDTDFANGRALFVGAALGALAGLLGIASSFAMHSLTPPDSALRRQARRVAGALLPLSVLAPVAFLLCLAIRA